MNFHAAISGLVAASLIAFSTPLLAAPWDGDRLVVTASRSDRAKVGLSRVSVIDRDELERSQAPDLIELLRLQAGIDVVRSGGPGGQTSVFMRGSNSNHVLVLIDGVRVAAAGTGAFAWESLDPAIIERIEIVRGPRAARWGSDAIGGVIQIFTRQPQGAHVRAGYGRYRDRSLSAGWGSSQFGISLASRKVDGFSAQNERGFAYDPDDDGFDNHSLALGGEYDAAGGRWSWRARANDGEVEFDQGVSDLRSYSAHTDYRHEKSGAWRWLISAGLMRDQLETETPFSKSETVTRRLQSAFQAERQFGQAGLWLLGLDAWRESGHSDSWSGSRYNIGAWTGLEGGNERFDWELSLRADDDQRFGSAATGSLAGGWHPANGWKVFARLARAFRAPNFNQLYSQGFGGLYAGNPELDPETSVSLELGVDWLLADGQRLALSLFDQRIDDLIDFSGPDFAAVNIDRARIRGAELVYDLTVDNWRGQAGLTWQEPEDRDTGAALVRRTKEKAFVSLDYLFAGGGWAGVEIIHTGQRPDIGGTELESFSLINLRAGWPLAAGLRIEARLDNLADSIYEPLYGFNARRRAWFVALSWQG